MLTPAILSIGLHSGPVTAGVLRGDRARFQLFGDTVNTTARIESSGTKNRIHISQETHDFLVAAGKRKWITPREEKIQAKGKGEMQTYWIKAGSRSHPTTSISNESNTTSSEAGSNAPPARAIYRGPSKGRKSRPINKGSQNQKIASWTVEVLARRLKEVVARRKELGVVADSDRLLTAAEQHLLVNKTTCLSEIREVIELPKYNQARTSVNVDEALPATVMLELKDFVETVASLYPEVSSK